MRRIIFFEKTIKLRADKAPLMNVKHKGCALDQSPIEY